MELLENIVLKIAKHLNYNDINNFLKIIGKNLRQEIFRIKTTSQFRRIYPLNEDWERKWLRLSGETKLLRKFPILYRVTLKTSNIMQFEDVRDLEANLGIILKPGDLISLFLNFTNPLGFIYIYTRGSSVKLEYSRSLPSKLVTECIFKGYGFRDLLEYYGLYEAEIPV